MRLNKTAKGLVVALPMLALAACSSSDTTSVDSETETNQGVVQQQESNVQVEPAQRQKTPEEIRSEKIAELRRDHIIYFDFDKSRVNSEFSALLDSHAEFLSENSSVKVLIEGHADERGTPEYNIALGERRAKAVSKYLQNLGVTASQITIVSYGEEKPALRDRTEAAFAKNRRAVLVY